MVEKKIFWSRIITIISTFWITMEIKLRLSNVGILLGRISKGKSN